MTVALAILAGGMFAAGVYLLLRRDLVRVVLALSLLGNAVNLAILAGGGLVGANPPIVDAGLGSPREPWADPVPQALILTAIVISFAVTAFSLALLVRQHQHLGVTDARQLDDESAEPDAARGAPPTEKATP